MYIHYWNLEFPYNVIIIQTNNLLLQTRGDLFFSCTTQTLWFIGTDRMIVGFTTTCAISAYHHWCREFESRSGRGVRHYVIKFSQWLATDRWFSLGPPVSSTNKTDGHDITEILLKVALNTIKFKPTPLAYLLNVY